MTTPLSSSEFSRLLIALARDVVSAHIHWKLFLDLGRALQEHPVVAQQSNTFWSVTRQAHLNTSVQCLCRVFDQEKSAVHLRCLLETIQCNLQLFEEEEFKERYANNQF